MLSSWLKKLGRGKRRRTKRGGAMPGTAPALTLELLELRRVFVSHAIGDTVQPFLRIFVNGAEVAIPKNVGVTSTSTFSPHTEDTTGKLFISGTAAGIDGAARFVTLDDFFDVWRTTNVGDSSKNNPNAFFSSTQLLGNVADANNGVFMTVNGIPNTEFENYIPEDGDRIVLSYGPKTGAPTLAPIANTTLLGGSPLYVSLDGFDPNGQAITYTVTANSNPSLVTTSVTSGNPSIRMQVDGFGAMTFQLLQDKAPRPTNRVVTLANQNFYDNLTFHRVINNFGSQGGARWGRGAGGSSLGNFDDQFHVDLQHNRSGLLSYAKSSDDTNNSQFFVTEGTSRHLDFNHSIFGVLTEGESVRDAISNVAVDSSSRPTTPVTIDTVDVITDNQNGLLFLKAAEGASGTATLTVTATDSAGNSTSRTFTVTVTPDTANGGPFLNDIPAQRTTINTAKTIQLSSQDVEGNAVTYSAVKGDSLSSTVTVNSTTGLITATPPTGFVGQMLIRASVASATGQPNDTQDKSDVQTFALTVAPLAPTGLDLPDASDTGTSTTDNRTKLTTPAITINGVTSGATVKLFEGTTLLGSATASGTSVTITTSALTSGAHTLTATQTVNSVESDTSAGLTITVDADAPSFTSTPPATAKVGTALTYDAATNEEGAVGLVYSLTSAPTGVTIDAASGIVSWTPTAAQLGAQSFQVVATDSAGNSATQNVALTVSDVDLVQFRMQITDTNGTAITSLVPNQSFLLRVLAKDLRSNPSGLFAGYLDVTYQGNLAQVDGALTYGSLFPNVKSGSTSTAGLIDEGGAVSGFTAGDGSEVLLFSVPMKATASGTLTFTGDPADVTPSHNVLLFSRNDPVAAGQIKFVSASITIGSSINAANDTFNVNEDSAQTTLTVLANDTLAQGATGTLTVSAVGTTNNGGTISVAAGGTGVRYQPAANFFGAETFTYTVTNGSDSATATATVTVQPVNDPPTGAADSFQVPRNSANNVLDVLANDLSTPDATETLRVTAVSNVVGGTATVGTNGAFVNFTPTAGFTGTASFTYTLADPSNATATGTATITVDGTNTSPTAANDTASVAEDSTNNTINVLANDSTGPDVGETLTVTVVGTPSSGGTAAVGPTGTNVRYTPAANFVGTETFTYTISDGNGGTATATATITVTNVNDNPTAVNDTANVPEDSSNVTINVLTNDLSTPDTGETLRVTAVTQGSNGGQVTVGANGANVSYKPAANFLGNETFTYTISDGNGGTATGTVTVTVANGNDNPTAVNDTATVPEDSTANVINVLANDSSAPDVGETLTVSSAGPGSENGGTVTVGTGGANVVYTPPANFVGVDKFTYAISDGNGGQATATVTVTVTNTNDPPFAGEDSFVVGRNSSAQTLNVLANDSDPDAGDTRTISAVGTTSNGGTVTIAADGKSLLYTPAANYLGPDSFTYTVRDGANSTSTGNVTISVAEFQPSSVSGTVYIDLNRDGTQQSSEPGIARVTVRLIGPQGASSTTRTMLTDARGRYEFTGLPPGDYVVEQSQPMFLQDGNDQAGTQGGVVGAVGSDRISFALAQNTQAQRNNFAEYRSSALIRFRDFLARTPREFALAALDSTGNAMWAAGWSDLSLQDVTRTGSNNFQLHTVDSSSTPLVATLQANSTLLETLQNSANGQLLRFNGDPTYYTFVPQGASGEGEVSSPAPTLFSTLPSELNSPVTSTAAREIGSSNSTSAENSSTATNVSTGAVDFGSNSSASSNSTTGSVSTSTGSNRAAASGESSRTAATDAAMAQLVQSSTPPVGTRGGLGRFSARRALVSNFASSVDRVMSGF